MKDNRNTPERRFRLSPLEVICHDNEMMRRSELEREGFLYVRARTGDDSDRWTFR